MKNSSKLLRLLLASALLFSAILTGSVSNADEFCIPDGCYDDSGFRTDCCSGCSVPGSQQCTSGGDCYHICGPCDQT